MAGLDDIFAGLGSEELAAYAANMQPNPFSLGGQQLGSAKINYSTFSPGESLATSFGQAFMSGLMQGYGHMQRQQEINNVAHILPQVYADPNMATPAGFDESAFNALKTAALVKRQSAESAFLSDMFKRRQDLQGKVDEAVALAPVEVEKERAKNAAGLPSELLKSLFANPEKAALAQRYMPDAYSKVFGGSASAPADGVASMPDGSTAKAGDARLSSADIDRVDPLVKAKTDQTDTLRKEFAALPEVKTMSIIQPKASAFMAALADPSRVGDQELVRYALLMIEPTSVVREGEAAAIANSQALLPAAKGQLLSALNGESTLQPDARAALMRLGLRAYEGHKAQYDKVYDVFSRLSENRGLNPADVTYLGKSPESSSLVSAAGLSKVDQAKAILKSRGVAGY